MTDGPERNVAITSRRPLTAAELEPHLRKCGYTRDLLHSPVRSGARQGARLLGFARLPPDTRTACVLVAEVSEDSESTIAGFRALGAPIVLACYRDTLQWWRQSAGRPELIETLSSTKIDSFFKQHKDEFSPDAVYRAKTWGRFERQYQLTFVDVGLMPVIERETGEALGRLIERKVSWLTTAMKWRSVSAEQGKWLMQSVFWLVAAKILADKRVATFADLDLTNVEAAFTRVAAHYGADSPVGITNKKQREALHACAADIARFSDLSHVSTESLAYVYENTLISKKTRRDFGTHSTPPCLIDYVVGKLADWIADIPANRRHVFEPACGHAGFLVSALRLLRELRLEANANETPRRRHEYLQQRLHGCEIDAFALEIARLSLTLADVPNPNGWDLQQGDMFSENILREQSRGATILLANPPFQDFTPKERREYGERGVSPRLQNKTAEMLIRTLPHLPTGAVFGIVVPQGLLHSTNAAPLRQVITGGFELSEICLFADKLFQKSDVESAILLGKRVAKRPQKKHTLSYRRVREPDIGEFKQTYAVSSRRGVEQRRFSAENDWDMSVPELEETWEWCENHPRFADVAHIGKGLEYVGQDKLPPEVITLSTRRFKEGVPGFARFERHLHLHGLPGPVWMNLSCDVVAHPRTGTITNVPQVLLNYARVSRGPWRLKGLLDESGHAVTSRFLTVRPLNSAIPLEFYWALCNSPVANAFAYTHSMKRDILVGTMRQMPIPHSWEAGVDPVVQAARAYLRAVTGDPDSLLVQQRDPDCLCRLLLQVDAEVLRLYDLPSRLERELLDLFAGSPRLGVPFEFDRYYPPDFEPCFPLHEYLSDSFQQSTAGALRERHQEAISPEISAAMQAAVEAFQE